MAVILVGGGRELTRTAGCPGLPPAGPRCLPAVAVSSTGSAHHLEWWSAASSTAAVFSGASPLGPAHKHTSGAWLAVTLELSRILYRQYIKVVCVCVRVQLHVLPVYIFVVCWPLGSAMPPQWLSCLGGRAPVAVGQQGEAWPGWSAELRRGGVVAIQIGKGGNREEKSQVVKISGLCTYRRSSALKCIWSMQTFLYHFTTLLQG